MSLHAVAVPGAKTRPPPALCRALFEFHSTPLRANGQGKTLPPMYVHQHLRTGAAQVQGVNGASSKTGAQPAPHIGLLCTSAGAGFGPKMGPAPFTAEPAPSTAEPAPSACQWALFATPQPMYVQKNGISARFRCTYISTFGRGRRKFRVSTAQVPK